jgi:hypothetical protein
MVLQVSDFSAKFGTYTEATPVLQKVQAVQDLYQNFVTKVTVPLKVKNAINAKRDPLASGVKYHLDHLNAALTKGLPNDPRFPDRDVEWISKRTTEKNQLVEWLETFRAEFAEYSEARVRHLPPFMIFDPFWNSLMMHKHRPVRTVSDR